MKMLDLVNIGRLVPLLHTMGRCLDAMGLVVVVRACLYVLLVDFGDLVVRLFLMELPMRIVQRWIRRQGALPVVPPDFGWIVVVDLLLLPFGLAFVRVASHTALASVSFDLPNEPPSAAMRVILPFFDR